MDNKQVFLLAQAQVYGPAYAAILARGNTPEYADRAARDAVAQFFAYASKGASR